MRRKRLGQAVGFTCLLVSIGPMGCSEESDSSVAVGESVEPAPRQSAIGPQAIDAALAAAEDYFSRKDLASAEAILAKLIEQAPREHRAHELYGRVLYLRGIEVQQRGEPQTAATLFEQAYDHYRTATATAVELDPLSAAGLHQSAGEIASAAGLADEALAHFREAGRLDPTSTKHPLYEAQPLIQQRRFAEAKSALQRALALDPDEAFAYASLAMVALEENDAAAAVRHIEEARRIEPANLALRVQEAKIHRRCNQPRRALDLLVMLDDQQRAEEAVAYEIAECYRMLGEPLKVARAWAHRSRLHPMAWLAAVHAAEALLEADQREQAWLWYQRARLAAPEAPQVKALEEVFESAG